MAPLLQRPPPALRLAFLTLVGLLLLAGSCATHAFRILAVFPHPAKSHFAFFEPLVKELAARGHDVTVLSHFPQRSRTPNYTDVSLQGTVPLMDTLTVAQVQHLTPISDFHVIHTIGLESCKPILTSPQVESFLAKEQRFDLFLSEAFTTDCFLGFAHRFKVPTVALSSAVLFSTVNDRFGNPANPAHVPNPFLGYGSRMTFTERLFNTLADLYMSWARSYYYDSPANWIAKRTFGRDMPSLDKLAKNTSLVLVNSHFSLHRPRPAVPAVVEVGGLHIKPASKLPKDIEKFISGAKDGVILFSMGSILQSKSLPEKRLKAFMQAFAELPQRVLWKYENDTLPDKPSNVMISPWIPQRDVLEHTNVKLFITHGGLLGLSEAVFCGVPILGIPMFGDQAYNVQAAVEAGVGELFPYYRTPYTNSILKAIRKVLDDDRYRNKARELSGVYRDRPSPPLDTAVYWVEYVARHGGASLRSPTIDLSTVEYLLLDVVAFLLALAAAVAFVAHRIYTNSDFSVLKAFFENKSKTK